MPSSALPMHCHDLGVAAAVLLIVAIDHRLPDGDHALPQWNRPTGRPNSSPQPDRLDLSARAYVLLTRGHVNVELVPLALGQRSRFVLALLAYGASAALCLMLTYYSFTFWYVRHGMATGTRTPSGRPNLEGLPGDAGRVRGDQPAVPADLLRLLSGREPPFGIIDSNAEAA